MELKAKHYLKKREIDDINITQSYKNKKGNFVIYTSSLSEVMENYLELNEELRDKGRFTVDIIKPQFKWFLLLVVFMFIGIAHVAMILITYILSIFVE